MYMAALSHNINLLMYSSRKYPHPPWKVSGNSKGKGGGEVLKEKYGGNMRFLEGWGGGATQNILPWGG